MPTPLQPFLHDLVTAFAAPTQVWSDRTGDLMASAEGSGSHGIIHADIRAVSELRLTVDGRPPEHLATSTGPGTAEFTGIVRRLAGGPPMGADPQLRIDRRRSVTPGLVTEEMCLSATLTHPTEVSIELVIGSDFAGIDEIKVGRRPAPVMIPCPSDTGPLTWQSGDTAVTLDAPGAQLLADVGGQSLRLTWPVTVSALSPVTVGCTLRVTDTGGAVVAASTPPLEARSLAADAATAVLRAGVVEPRLQPWLEQSLGDLNSLRMATATDPDDTFFAAGAPWFLTLFGRDSLWSARLLLPLDVAHSATTLRTLARLQGRTVDDDSAEAPGKIMHELRRGQFSFGSTSLSPLYYGTVDATPLWVCLLHDAWRAGLDPDVITQLLPTLRAALDWLSAYGDPDGDGFLEYIDTSGHGLTNQGWKDSGDAVRFADGSLAEGPVALCEVQGYAFQAAMSGAELLDAFDDQDGDRHRTWAGQLAERFREQFWCEDATGRYPALALDGRKRRVDSVTSNMGHLLGTGLLNPEEERLVAVRLAQPDMDSGLGLRTMSSRSGGYSPLSYHCGSVWPHDTAIVVAGLVRAGLAEHATGLVEGLLRASVHFDQRLPELWSGEGRPVPYPAACRPQAWSAAAAVTVASALMAARHS